MCKAEAIKRRVRSSVLKASRVECQLMPLINTQSTSWSTLANCLDQHLIDISINAWSTLDRHLSQQSIKKQLIKWVNTSSESTLGRLLTDCQSSANQDVDGLSIEGTDWHLTAEAIDTQWSLCLSYLTLILLRCQSVAESVCKRNAWQAWKPSS